MTLLKAIEEFIDNIYTIYDTIEEKYIINLKLGNTNNKDIFKNILANEYIKILKEFTENYNTMITQNRMQYIIDFLEKYYKVSFNYNLNDLN